MTDEMNDDREMGLALLEDRLLSHVPRTAPRPRSPRMTWQTSGEGHRVPPLECMGRPSAHAFNRRS